METSCLISEREPGRLREMAQAVPDGREGCLGLAREVVEVADSTEGTPHT